MTAILIILAHAAGCGVGWWFRRRWHNRYVCGIVKETVKGQENRVLCVSYYYDKEYLQQRLSQDEQD